MSPAALIAIAVAAIFVLRRRDEDAAAYYAPPAAPSPLGPSRNPLVNPPRDGHEAGTRKKVEQTTGAILGGVGGAVVCGGAATCAALGAAAGSTLAPLLSRGAEAAGRGAIKGVTGAGKAAWNNTLGRLF
jgi:hypothetical protein